MVEATSSMAAGEGVDGAYFAWDLLPDNLLMLVFGNLTAAQLLRVALVCKQWSRVAIDEFLWKDLLLAEYCIHRAVTRAPGRTSWLAEYRRLHFLAPCVESEVLVEHRDQVLHISFSHNGKMFATCSKDGFVKVWTSTYPARVQFYADMRDFTWKYTQFSQFNESDTLLLVSGVHFGSHSTSGEIAVFSLRGGNFELQCRVLNKPYDIFGSWYNDNYLLSGSIYWRGHLSSSSVLWLNKASQALESEQESVVMRLYKFLNQNASSVRTIMVAECLQTCAVSPERKDLDCVCQPNESTPPNTGSSLDCCHGNVRRDSSPGSSTKGRDPAKKDVDNVISNKECSTSISSNTTVSSSNNSSSSSSTRDNIREAAMNGTIHYAEDYRLAECTLCGQPQDSSGSESSSCVVSHSSSRDAMECSEVQQLVPECSCASLRDAEGDRAVSEQTISTGATSPAHLPISSLSPHGHRKGQLCDEEGALCNHSNSSGCPQTGQIYENSAPSTGPKPSSGAAVTNPDGGQTLTSGVGVARDGGAVASKSSRLRDKLLIFTMGKKTYTPHQIGIKKITAELAQEKMEEMMHRQKTSIRDLTRPSNVPLPGEVPDVGIEHEEVDQEESEVFEEVDQMIELHGHIIGMCLSPDQRYLYVNSRPWPQNYHIDSPVYPPPIAQEIDIHVIDLLTMQEVGTMLRSHKAYTPNDECFFIFLDVCDDYVASGAEDKHGYLWDRHYGVCLTKFPHKDVVNCVAFNPKDPQTLVTASDDHTLKIWRSRNRQREVKRTAKAAL